LKFIKTKLIKQIKSEYSNNINSLGNSDNKDDQNLILTKILDSTINK